MFEMALNGRNKSKLNKEMEISCSCCQHWSVILVLLVIILGIFSEDLHCWSSLSDEFKDFSWLSSETAWLWNHWWWCVFLSDIVMSDAIIMDYGAMILKGINPSTNSQLIYLTATATHKKLNTVSLINWEGKYNQS